MSECAGCKERDLRIQQLCVEIDRIEEAKHDAERALHRLRREQENPK